MTVHEAAKALEISTRLVYKLCELGLLGHHRVGVGRGKVLITPAQVQAYLDRTEVAPAPESPAERSRSRRQEWVTVPDHMAEITRRKAERQAALAAAKAGKAGRA